MLEQPFLFGVAVESGYRAQPPRDRGTGTTLGFEIASEALDVHTASVEQPELVIETPRRVLT